MWQRLRDTEIDYQMILRERREWLLTQVGCAAEKSLRPSLAFCALGTRVCSRAALGGRHCRSRRPVAPVGGAVRPLALQAHAYRKRGSMWWRRILPGTRRC